MQDALFSLVEDDKLQVRLTASAAYLKVTGAAGAAVSTHAVRKRQTGPSQ